MLTPNGASMNEESLYMQVISPFWKWTLSEVTMSKATIITMVVCGVKIVFVVYMIVGHYVY